MVKEREVARDLNISKPYVFLCRAAISTKKEKCEEEKRGCMTSIINT